MGEYEWFNVLVNRYGIPTVLLGYYIYKDWKFTNKLVELMTQIKECLNGGVKNGEGNSN